MSTSKNTSSVFTALEKIPKLQDNEGYLKWKRTVRDHLKLFELWTYIASLKVVPEDASKVEDWTAGQERTCTALRLVVDGNAYNDIEDLTNASDAWDLLEANFKPRGSGFLNNSMEKLFSSPWLTVKTPPIILPNFAEWSTNSKVFRANFSWMRTF